MVYAVSANNSVHSLNTEAIQEGPVNTGAEQQPVALTQDAMFARSQRKLWKDIEAGNADSLTKHLQRLTPAERNRFASTPKVSNDFEPKLPLCVAAAHGSRALMQALLQSSGACPLGGDKSDDVVLTALYWAARYGLGETMDFLHDDYGVPAAQVLLACEESCTPQLAAWVKKHDLGGSHLDRAMQQAVERDDLDSVVSLTKYGDARVNIVANDNANERRSLLSYAIANGKLAAASALIDAGADADGQSHGLRVESNEKPLWLAITGHQLGMIRRLRGAGALAGVSHLKHALSQGEAAATVYAALTETGLAPRSQEDAKDLQRLAIAGDNLELVALITAQRTMVERQEIQTHGNKGLRRDAAYLFAQEQVNQFTRSLRDGKEGAFALPEGFAMLTDSAPVKRKARGIHKLTRVFRHKPASIAPAVNEERTVAVATRRYER